VRLADLRLATKQARQQVSCAGVRVDTVPTGPDVSGGEHVAIVTDY